MATVGMPQVTKRTLFDYVLEDFLELKASIGANKVGTLRTFLESKKGSELSIVPVEGFAVNRQLVLLRKGSPQSFENLVFLNPKSGWIRVKPL